MTGLETVFGVIHNFHLGSPFKPVLAFFLLAALVMQSGVEELTVIFVKRLPCVSNCSRHFHELYHLLLTTTLEGRCFCSHFDIKQFVTLRAVPTIPTQQLQTFGPEANTHALYYLLNSPCFRVSVYVSVACMYPDVRGQLGWTGSHLPPCSEAGNH